MVHACSCRQVEQRWQEQRARADKAELDVRLYATKASAALNDCGELMQEVETAREKVAELEADLASEANLARQLEAK